MLPFMKKRQAAGMIVKRLGKPDMEVANEVHVGSPDDSDDALKSVAMDLMSAIENKSMAGLLSALKAFKEICYGDDSGDDIQATEGLEDEV